MEDLTNTGKGIKANFALDKYLAHRDLQYKMHLNRFDILVNSILSYGAELWGFGTCKKLEQVHLRYLQKLLNVKTSTASSLLYAETGRLPLIYGRYLAILRYWLCLKEFPNHLVSQVNGLLENNGWNKNVENLLENCGIDVQHVNKRQYHYYI